MRNPQRAGARAPFPGTGPRDAVRRAIARHPGLLRVQGLLFHLAIGEGAQEMLAAASGLLPPDRALALAPAASSGRCPSRALGEFLAEAWIGDTVVLWLGAGARAAVPASVVAIGGIGWLASPADVILPLPEAVGRAELAVCRPGLLQRAA